MNPVSLRSVAGRRVSALRVALVALSLIVVLLGPAIPAAAQLPDDPDLAEAFLAWDRGDYDVALERYLDVLRGPDAARHLPEVARLTGEPFQVTELAADGADVRVSADGRYASWEVEDPETGPVVTRVVELSDPGRIVATLPGAGVRISAGGQAVYASIRPSPELESAAEAVDRARAAGDRDAFFAALRQLEWQTALHRELRLRDLASGEEHALDPGEGWLVGEAVFAPDSEDLFVVASRVEASDPAAPQAAILHVRDGTATRPITVEGAYLADPHPVAGGRWLVAEAGSGLAVPVAPDGSAPDPAHTGLVLHDLREGTSVVLPGGRSPAVAADGSLLAFLAPAGDGGGTAAKALRLRRVSQGGSAAAGGAALPGPGDAVTLIETDMDVANPAVSPDGAWVAYQKRPIHDWEIFAVRPGAGGPAGTPDDEVQVTREIQHDLFPVFVDRTTILAAKGEGRHRRSFLYDLGEGDEATLAGATGEGLAGPEVTKLFHNNTVRTIAPEYEWVPTPDGTGVLIVSERDGDTVSPERAVYLVHLDRPVTLEQVRTRLERELEAERDLRTRARVAFEPIAERVREVTERVDVGRIYHHAKVLHSFDSKYITRPGNRLASEYIARQLESWGYEVELQWFEPRPGIRTANVVARLPGTRNPELVYVVSSHYDSVERGPGADDNSSGTTALLEAARVLADRPQPATLEFAFFTGEEAGLLGSREYVRRAVQSGKRIVGALNNDMVGFANNHRLDNTIRYSNPGIRDIQHGAAILFSDLITYDALYYKSTDAHAYYEVYGDIVGGIGSYPVLGSPFYHQFSDRLNTINQRLVAEVSRVTVATLVHLSSSPSRVAGLELEVEARGDATRDLRVRWEPAPEGGITGYRVEWHDASGDRRSMTVDAADGTEASLQGVAVGSVVGVKAVNDRGMEGWDWARVEVPGSGGASARGR